MLRSARKSYHGRSQPKCLWLMRGLFYVCFYDNLQLPFYMLRYEVTRSIMFDQSVSPKFIVAQMEYSLLFQTFLWHFLISNTRTLINYFQEVFQEKHLVCYLQNESEEISFFLLFFLSSSSCFVSILDCPFGFL